MKYRKKSVVDAEQATDSGVLETKWGPQEYTVGDWIITNPDGERYPCPTDTFLETYEVAE